MMHKLNHDTLIKSASYASVIVAAVIMCAKTYGYIITGSQSVFASWVDSLLDITSSLINLIALRISLLPPDDNHRFGHDKFQDLAIFSQSVFFFFSSCAAIIIAVRSLFLHQVAHNHEMGASIILLCIVLTAMLVVYQSYVVKKTSSKMIEVDKMHYFSDFVNNLAVIASIYLSTHFWFIDALTGIVISCYILYASYHLFVHSLKNLVDEEFAVHEKRKIIDIVKKYKEVAAIHELKTRKAGNKCFIQFHAEIDGNMSLYLAHELTDKIYEELLTQFPNAEIIIHADPIGFEHHLQYRETLKV